MRSRTATSSKPAVALEFNQRNAPGEKRKTLAFHFSFFFVLFSLFFSSFFMLSFLIYNIFHFFDIVNINGFNIFIPPSSFSSPSSSLSTLVFTWCINAKCVDFFFRPKESLCSCRRQLSRSATDTNGIKLASRLSFCVCLFVLEIVRVRRCVWEDEPMKLDKFLKLECTEK